jgi:hypothetical protein
LSNGTPRSTVALLMQAIVTGPPCPAWAACITFIGNPLFNKRVAQASRAHIPTAAISVSDTVSENTALCEIAGIISRNNELKCEGVHTYQTVIVIGGRTSAFQRLGQRAKQYRPKRNTRSTLSPAHFLSIQPWRMVRFLLPRDIGVGTEPSDDVSALIANWHSPSKEPAEISVPTSQRKRVLPGLAAIGTLSDALVDLFDMIRMNQLLPIRVCHVLRCCPRIVMPTFVEPSPSTARIGRPSKLAHVVRKFAKSSFAFCKYRFGTLAFRNFLGNDVNAPRMLPPVSFKGCQ